MMGDAYEAHITVMDLTIVTMEVMKMIAQTKVCIVHFTNLYICDIKNITHSAKTHHINQWIYQEILV